jgi:hypothetical protein
MTDTADKLDYSKTLYLPADRVPDARRPAAEGAGDWSRWQQMDLYKLLREDPPPVGRSSCCMTARPMPTATSISATR